MSNLSDVKMGAIIGITIALIHGVSGPLVNGIFDIITKQPSLIEGENKNWELLTSNYDSLPSGTVYWFCPQKMVTGHDTIIKPT